MAQFFDRDDFMELFSMRCAGQDKRFLNAVEEVLDNCPPSRIEKKKRPVEIREQNDSLFFKYYVGWCGCGAQINDNENYCWQCGCPIDWSIIDEINEEV